jgi:hypothetical protein
MPPVSRRKSPGTGHSRGTREEHVDVRRVVGQIPARGGVCRASGGGSAPQAGGTTRGASPITQTAGSATARQELLTQQRAGQFAQRCARRVFHPYPASPAAFSGTTTR